MNNNTLPDLNVPYSTTLSQSFDTDDLAAESVQFILVQDGVDTVLLDAPLEIDPNDSTRQIADLTLDGTKTSIDTPDNNYKLMLIYGPNDRIRLPEPDADCMTGDCDLPKFYVCDIPAES